MCKAYTYICKTDKALFLHCDHSSSLKSDTIEARAIEIEYMKHSMKNRVF